MNLKKNIKSKKGSYIVEAAITLPLFIIAIVTVSLVLSYIASIESTNYALADEMRKVSINAYENEALGLAKSVAVCGNIKKTDKRIQDITITNFEYLFERNEIQDLIAIGIKAKFSIKYPIGIAEKFELKERIMLRGFTGRDNSGETLNISDFQESTKSGKVYVFPKYGNRYHSANCVYVKRNYENEYKIEMELEEAKNRGYSKCKVCKGGESG